MGSKPFCQASCRFTNKPRLPVTTNLIGGGGFPRAITLHL